MWSLIAIVHDYAAEKNKNCFEIKQSGVYPETQKSRNPNKFLNGLINKKKRKKPKMQKPELKKKKTAVALNSSRLKSTHVSIHAKKPNISAQVASATERTKRKKEKPVLKEVVDLENDDGFRFPHTPMSKRGTTKETAISVEQYINDRDLNLAIVAPLQSITKQDNLIDLSQDDIGCHRETKEKEWKQKEKSGDSVTEKGQSSNSKNNPDFVCEICVEHKSENEAFSIKGCTHVYCTECILRYVASKLQENITTIGCPVSDCKGLLEPEHCRSILPHEVFDRWGNALCEALILGSQKFYCPFKDCTMLLIDDCGEFIMESECPNCWRLFCAQCKVPWHAGVKCEEFQKLHKDEREREAIMLMKLAESKQWKRCPSCRIYVERTMGCKYMKCRCGTAFCYGCGSTKVNATYHNCTQCGS